MGNRIVFIGLLLGEFAMVVAFSALVNRISSAAAAALFFAYAVVNGLTMSVIFLSYTASSIGSTFFVTAGTFGANQRLRLRDEARPVRGSAASR